VACSWPSGADRSAHVKGKAEIAPALARLHTDGVAALFGFGSQPDFKQASVNIAVVDQGGLGLPDRDYCVKDEARFADVRSKYPAHVQRMFQLLGEAPEAAARDAQTVLDVETALARASLERVKRRDPANRYHKMSRAELLALAPGFDWSAYFAATGAPDFSALNVAWPDFFKTSSRTSPTRSATPSAGATTRRCASRRTTRWATPRAPRPSRRRATGPGSASRWTPPSGA
jgi:predicted metalloendopeptidase